MTQAQTKTTGKDISRARGAQPPRMAAVTRKALMLIATMGITQKQAAKEAGMSEFALSRALQRKDVAAELIRQKQAFVDQIDGLKETAKRRAIVVGLELMGPEYPATVRARMVEFFAREPAQPMQIVNNNNVLVNHEKQGGYEFARPGARVVDIIEAKVEFPEAQIAQDQTQPD